MAYRYWFSSNEMKSRTAKLGEKMRERRIDCTIAMDDAYSYYFSGCPTASDRRPTWTLIPMDGDPAMILSRIEEHHAEITSWIKDIKAYDDMRPSIESAMMLTKEFLVERGLKSPTIGIIEPCVFIHRLKKELPHTKFVDISDMLQLLIAVKSDEEIEIMRQGAEMCDFACAALLNVAKEGVSELEMVAEACRAAAYEITKRFPDYYEVKMPLIGVQTGPEKTLDPHSLPTLRKLKRGDLLSVYPVVTLCGYLSHMQRMAVLGQPSGNIRKISEVIIEAFEKGCDMVRPGVKYGDIDREMREIITKAEYGKYIVHGSGHALGIKLTEMQEVRVYNETPLQERHIINIEPGIYVPGIGGWNQSEQFLVTKTGSERQTKHPLGLIVI